jgi:alpha-beta hydrolase superfamily lysophospholipase
MQQQNILDASGKPFKLNLPDRIIHGALHLPGIKRPPCVITCHGLFSTMDSDKFTAIADAFTMAGIAIIRFDFSGCGKSSGNISDTTISRRIAELEKVVDFSKNHPALGKKFGILGSSLGGYVALFFASENHVDALSVWATPYDLAETCNNLHENDLKILNQSFFDDASKYNLSSILTKIDTLQIIHGKKDLTVPWQHAEKIYNVANHPKKLIFFPKGDHSISTKYDREKAVNESLNWILNSLINT